MSRWPAATIGRLLAVLIIVGAALFVIGVVAERQSGHHDEPAATATAESAGESGDEAAEHSGAGSEASPGTAAEQGESSEERVLGVDLESPGLVAAVVLASVGLAVWVWRRQNTVALVVVAVFAGVFAVFDIAEVAHQVNESRPGIAVLAGVLAVIHIVVAAISVLALARRSPEVARAAIA
jgi:hypothetical protein